MNNLYVERVVKISAYFTPDQWQLYNDVDVAAFGKDGAAAYRAGVAFELNKTLCDYVNRGETRAAITTAMHSLMRHRAEYGASDTEPRAFLEQVLDAICRS